MRVGLCIEKFDWPGSPANMGEKLAEIARTADDMGFYSLWVMDHFFQVGYGYSPPEAPMLEGFSTISYLAAVTRQIKLGLEVTGNFYRHPGILIKTVTTLDVLSGGRAYFGIDAGWSEREAKGLGVSFPPTSQGTGSLIRKMLEILGMERAFVRSMGTSEEEGIHMDVPLYYSNSNEIKTVLWTERFERLEETLRIAKHMWRGDRSPFEGKYYQLEEPINSPQPLSKPHPPILIEGDGEKRTLRLVAEYGDACNLSLGSPLKDSSPKHNELYQNREERLKRKLKILREHCDKVARPYDDIERAVHGPIKIAPNAMNPTKLVELCQELAEMGIQHYIFNMPNVHEIEPIKIIGQEVIPQVAGIT